MNFILELYQMRPVAHSIKWREFLCPMVDTWHMFGEHLFSLIEKKLGNFKVETDPHKYYQVQLAQVEVKLFLL